MCCQYLRIVIRMSISFVLVLGKRGTGPVLIMEPGGTSNNVQLIAGGVGKVMNCLAHGDPEPKVTWWSSLVQIIRNNRRQPSLSMTTSLSPVIADADPLKTILPNNSLVIAVASTIRAQDRLYFCKASNKYGSIMSAPVRVTAVVEHKYSAQVYDEYVITDTTAVLICHLPPYVTHHAVVTAWIRDDGLRITPQYNDEIGKKYVVTQNGKLLVLRVTEADSDRMYRCETKHRVSGVTVVSGHAGQIHVATPSSGIPPRITDSSTEVRVKVGDTVLLPCVAQSNPPPTYSWCVRVHNGGMCDPVKLQGGKRMAGGSLVFKAQSKDSGSFVCTAKNNLGKQQIVTKLLVYEPLSVFIHPQSQIADIGQSVSLQCVISGGPVFFAQWLKDAKLVKNGDADSKSTMVLNITAVERSSAGMYQCIVGNDEQIKQASAQLMLSAVPPVLTEIFSRKIVQVGPEVNLTCSATGEPQPKIKWMLRDEPLTDSQGIKIKSKTVGDKTVSDLVIVRAEASIGGIYTCIAENKAGRDTFSEYLNVYGPPKVWQISNKTVVADDTLVLQCYVSGYPIESITWTKDGESLKNTHRIRTHDNGSLSINDVQTETDMGRYECTARSQGLTDSGYGYVKVINKPILQKMLEEIVIQIGGRLHLSCHVINGDPPFMFTWYYNGGKVPHDLHVVVTDSVYMSTISSTKVSRKHSGNYSCSAKNMAGVQSVYTLIKVKGSPVWENKPKSTTVTVGKSIKLLCSGRGFPVPTASWTIQINDSISKSMIASDPNIVVHQNGSLQIKSVRKKNFDATYICTVSNGVKPDLVAYVTLTPRTNKLIFAALPNNINVKKNGVAQLSCQALGIGPFAIVWINGTLPISPESIPRVQILNREVPGGVHSTLQISRSTKIDSGLYTCKISNDDVTNSTRLYLSVDGKISGTNYNGVLGEKIDVVPTLSSDNDSVSETGSGSSATKAQQLHGVALLYIIPTTTAAVVLFVILIVICLLLNTQRRRNATNNLQDETLRRSTLKKVSKTFYEDDDSLRYGRDGDRYYKVESDGATTAPSVDTPHLYSHISTYPRVTPHIQPYATFSSDKSNRYSDSAPGESSRMELKHFD